MARPEPGPSAPGSAAAAVAPRCTQPKVGRGRQLEVTVGGTRIDFNTGEFTAQREPADKLHSFSFVSTDGRYLLELNVLDQFQGACPAVFQLPTAESLASLYLAELDEDDEATAIADSDSPGASGTLTLDSYSTSAGREVASFSCEHCVLAPKASLSRAVTVSGRAHDAR